MAFFCAFISVFFSVFICSPTLAAVQNGNGSITHKPPIFLGKGEQQLITTFQIERYSLGCDSVRALPLHKSLPQYRDSILIKAIKTGPCDLWVWKKNGKTEHYPIRVVRAGKKDLEPNLFTALQELKEVQVHWSGDKIVIHGPICSWREIQTLSSIEGTFSKNVTNRSIICPSLLKEARKKLETYLIENKLQSFLRVELQKNFLWLRGTIPDSRNMDQIQQESLSIFPLLQTDLVKDPTSPVLHVQIYLLEISKSYLKKFGLFLGGSSQFRIASTSGALNSAAELQGRLDHMESHGHGRVLSKPELVVKTPGEAELFSGGELPIQTNSRYFSNVSWKNFGLCLKLKAEKPRDKQVEMTIVAETSHLDSKLSDQTVPGVQKNRLKTEVSARLGQPLFLSGLFKSKQSETNQGVPFLSQIPILGKAFGSESFQTDEMELIAILYPFDNLPSTPEELPGVPIFPKGPFPPPRNWIEPDAQRAALESTLYPWSYLE